MVSLRCIRFFVTATFLLSVPLLAQVRQTPLDDLSSLDLMNTHWMVGGKVTTLEGDPVHGAKVLVSPTTGVQARTLTTDARGEFATDYWLNIRIIKDVGVRLTVTKKGFLRSHALVDLGDPSKPWIIPVTLRDGKPDPMLLSQEGLITTLAPRLRKIGASEGLSQKSEKDYARGAEEFLDQERPERSLSSFAKVIGRDPSCPLCQTMRALAELESGDWEGAYRDLGEAITQGRANPKVARAEPLIAMGVMESWKHQQERAEGFLAEALKVAPADPLALQEIGRAELFLRDAQRAAVNLTKAMEAGAPPEARLLLVDALLGEGELDAANKGMTLYLNGRDVKTMPPPVRQLWARLRDREKARVAQVKAKSHGAPPLDYLTQMTPELQGLEPATDQKPLETILAAVGKNVRDLFQNFPNTSSKEEIHQEKLGRKNKVEDTLDSKAQYLCLIPEGAWGPVFEEYRANRMGALGQGKGLNEGFMLTSGFASASFQFHPIYQPQNTYRLRGRQKIHNCNAYVVAFAQQPAKARLLGNFKSGKTTTTTFTQGLAWIDPDTYQILRMRSDLLMPAPEVRLDRETTEIDYGQVRFSRGSEGFWLPREVTVTVAWNGKHMRNSHHYSNFKVFNVESTQKLGKLKTPAPAADEAVEPKAQR